MAPFLTEFRGKSSMNKCVIPICIIISLLEFRVSVTS